MRFKALYDKSNIKCHIVEIHALCCLWLRNPTKDNTMNSDTYVNQKNDETETQNLLSFLVPPNNC